jgi:hypothetical protein
MRFSNLNWLVGGLVWAGLVVPVLGGRLDVGHDRLSAGGALAGEDEQGPACQQRLARMQYSAGLPVVSADILACPLSRLHPSVLYF